MKLSLENISISKIGKSSGVFIGKTNTIKQFHHETCVNEVVGSLTGSKNKLTQSVWITNKVKGG
ncbi:hypothetical protein J1P26_22180 [Neobacillus sp. MM2021_6]|uniref:hypothetical protein n=1 Tax=Bacillaceae TaxID=186817 RepID=UPI0014099553|nr:MULTISPECIES: hypothetical protein [Bacillaceae]MBO0962414.1 hypothetical protein [Neobacillus sp. MM2021_6]NHC21017.1 hypothetical protein [Bacillus sp. MM2020_4]